MSSRLSPPRVGPYVVESLLATGGMAEVYLASREGPHGFRKQVALKRILPNLACDVDFVHMFVDEARVVAQLSHPNVVSVFDFGEEDGELYMAMEYIQGTSAARLLRAMAGDPSVVSLEVTLYIVGSVLRALDYAHNARGHDGLPLCVVHRDVSPSNVLLSEGGAVKLTDFGIARAAGTDRRTDVGQLKGKLGYMSPEQVIGRELDPRNDVFTVGIQLGELLAGEPLFRAENELDVLRQIRDSDLTVLERHRHRIPDDVATIVYRALARNPDDRYASAAHMNEAVETLLRRRRLAPTAAALASTLQALELVGSRPPVRKLSSLPPTERERRGGSVASVLELGPAAPPMPNLPSLSTPTNSISPILSKAAPQSLPRVWTIREAGRIRGPFTYPEVVEIFATGGLAPDAQIARGSSPFATAVSYSELVPIALRPSARWVEEVKKSQAPRSQIDRATLPARLFRIAMRRETGALTLMQGARKKRIYFVDGVPEYVVSTDKSELLGESLVRRGQLLRMEVEMALAMLPDYDGHLGDALVGLGIMRPTDLFRAAFAQLEERVMEVLRWESGEIFFESGLVANEDTLPLGVRPFELIARGLKEHYSSEEIAGLVAKLGDAPVLRVRKEPVRLGTFRLPEREERVLSTVPPRFSVPELRSEAIASRTATSEEVDRAIFLGLCCDILSCDAWVDPEVPSIDFLPSPLPRIMT